MTKLYRPTEMAAWAPNVIKDVLRQLLEEPGPQAMKS